MHFAIQSSFKGEITTFKYKNMWASKSECQNKIYHRGEEKASQDCKWLQKLEILKALAENKVNWLLRF